MKKAIITIILLIILGTQYSIATTLRGQVQGFNSYINQYYPISNIDVYLYFWNGYEWVHLASARTDINGMYYFYNVNPGFHYFIKTYYGQSVSFFVNSTQLFDISPIIMTG